MTTKSKSKAASRISKAKAIARAHKTVERESAPPKLDAAKAFNDLGSRLAAKSKPKSDARAILNETAHAAEKLFIESGAAKRSGIERNKKGYWTAVHQWADAHGLPYGTKKSKQAEPKVVRKRNAKAKQ